MMADQTPPNDEEIGVRGELTPTGFAAGIRSRFASAWDRRLGRRIDEGGFSREERMQLRDQRLRQEVAIRERMFDAGMSALEHDPERLRQAGLRWVGGLMRGEESLDFTFAKVEQYVPIEQAKAEARGTASPSGGEEIDPDYMTAWLRFVQDAGSDNKREIFARLLTGEIVCPSSPSIATLRILSELTTHNAQTFRNALRSCIGSRMLVKEADGGLELPIEELVELQDCGLVADSLRERYTEVTNDGGTATFRGRELSLQLLLKDSVQSMRLSGPRLTPAGEELAKAIDYDERPLYQRIVEVHKDKIEWAMVGVLEAIPEGYRLLESTRELIWPQEPTSLDENGGA